MTAADCFRRAPCQVKCWSAPRSVLALVLTQSPRAADLKRSGSLLAFYSTRTPSASYPLWLWRGILFLLRHATQCLHLTRLQVVAVPSRLVILVPSSEHPIEWWSSGYSIGCQG